MQWLIAVALAFGLVAVTLTACTWQSGEVTAVDRTTTEAFHVATGSEPWRAAELVSSTGGYIGALLIASSVAAVAGLKTRSFRLALLPIVAVYVAHFVVRQAKMVVARPRPPSSTLNEYAFPSGHVSVAMAVATCVVLLVALTCSRRTTLFALAASACYVVLIGITRMMLSAHYASDVLGGIAFGGLIALLAALVILGPSRALSPDRRRARDI